MIASVTPVTTLVTTGIVFTFILDSRNRGYTYITLLSLLLPKALWHNIRGNEVWL